MQPPNPTSAAAERLQAWRDGAVAPVWTKPGAHALHAYYTTCPESPDGLQVVLFASSRPDAQVGDLCLIDRASGEAAVLEAGVEVEDAHRQAAQQWSCGGAYVVAMIHCRDQWQVVRFDPRTRERVVLCTGRQLFMGSPRHDEVPLHGPPWNPGPNRDHELLNVRTGAIRTAVSVEQVIADHAGRLAEILPGARPDSITYPVISPDGTRVIFKLSRVRDGQFRSPTGSDREGLFIYDLKTGRPLGLCPAWGHPMWMPDSKRILRTHNVIDIATMRTETIPWYPQRSNSHASPSPDGELLAFDVARDAFTARELHWAVVVGDFKSAWHRLHTDPAPRHGTASWRPAHPHPVFSADGDRIYFNANLGDWTVLHVAERSRPST